MAELLLANYGASGITFSSRDDTIYSSAPGSAVEYVRKNTAQYYSIEVTTILLNKEKYRALTAFINALRGRFGTFTIKLPTESTPTGSNLTSITTTAGSSGTTLNVSCLSSAVINPGDKFTLPSTGDSKVYEVLSDDTGSGTSRTLTLTHPLRVNPSSGVTVQFNDILFTMRLTDDVIQYVVRPPELYQVSFSAREAL